MAHEIVMPQMGLSMDSGGIIQWLKKPGDWVAAGDLLLEVESDKATVEVESVESGILQIVLGPEDGAIPVGKAIGYLLSAEESLPAGSPRNAAAPPGTGNSLAKASAALAPAAGQLPGRLPSSPAARRRAQEFGLDWRAAAGSGPAGAIKERDVVRLSVRRPPGTQPAVGPAAASRASISPIARRLAESAGLDVEELTHRWPGRRVERSDVQQMIFEMAGAGGPAPVPPVAAAPDAPPAPSEKPGRRERMGRLRRLIAERMARSAHAAAAVTLTTEADATDLVAIREGLLQQGLPQDGLPDGHNAAPAPSYNALFAKLAAKALLEHPAVNASLDGEDITFWQTAHIGIAVESDRGLVVAVCRDVQAKPIHDLAREMHDLLGRAASGKALPDELTGGTFTITNLGRYEVDAFTPIINPPEAAILGVGRLIDRVVPVRGVPAVRTMVTLSLTFDHRIVDGAPAARFLQRIKQLVEQPYLWLI
jgi:pyruvate dehydrogenase E2 component (dihydrolipoyllysine-residue acetyltransferase)